VRNRFRRFYPVLESAEIAILPMPLVGGVELMSSAPAPPYSIGVSPGVSPRSDDSKIAAMASY
jgi:hypothetical protein